MTISNDHQNISDVASTMIGEKRQGVEVTFTPVDSLMFRDGRPFNQSDEGSSSAQSIFPPYPPTLVGASRAALWRKLGGTEGDWDAIKLGHGTDWQNRIQATDRSGKTSQSQLGPLSFGPPLLRFEGEPVFPVPLHIVTGEEINGQERFSRLEPGVALDCDLGTKVRLPAAVRSLDNIKNISDHWVTLEGMRKILAGNDPAKDDFIRLSDLWTSESRVGIGLQADTRTAENSQLYMATHVRLQPGVSFSVAIQGWNQAVPETNLQPLAGEHRMAQVEFGDISTELPAPPKITAGTRYFIVLVSPMVPEGQLPAPGERQDGMPGRVVSACIGKPISIGGWDSVCRKPIPLRQAVPAGSVWFMQLDDKENPEWSNSPKGLGIAAEWGFGHYLIGKW